MKLSKISTILSLLCIVNSAPAASILDRYRGSVQESRLDEQIRNYREKAALNAKVFGRGHTHRAGYDRHVGLEKLRKPLPAHVKKDAVPLHRVKAGLNAPPPKPLKYDKK
jgi:hypothetical protein